ncbi:hypothetical protein OHA72_36135 [Dactylosporangium sp. NBC_01737]|uniref:hypothetical protein n=1 Tax=Dactylosporangium sp. NBC_01737 TaxID=2975959 RepID=UPI002E0F1864|nr:hypothetical protein OHA72_36135 [Dactylosporangium sp. NBC_01737]
MSVPASSTPTDWPSTGSASARRAEAANVCTTVSPARSTEIVLFAETVRCACGVAAMRAAVAVSVARDEYHGARLSAAVTSAASRNIVMDATRRATSALQISGIMRRPEPGRGPPGRGRCWPPEAPDQCRDNPAAGNPASAGLHGPQPTLFPAPPLTPRTAAGFTGRPCG